MINYTMRTRQQLFVWALLQKPRHLQYNSLLPRQRVCVGTFTKTTPLTVTRVITKTRVIHTVTQAQNKSLSHSNTSTKQVSFTQ
jgi:hypothetical protein